MVGSYDAWLVVLSVVVAVVASIGSTLSLSLKTVETDRARMMEKLDIHDLAGLIKFAIQQSLASLD